MPPFKSVSAIVAINFVLSISSARITGYLFLWRCRTIPGWSPYLVQDHNRFMSALLRIADSSRTSRYVPKVPILLQKSKIERLRKSRESRFLETLAAAILSGANTKVGGRLVGNDVVPQVAAREAHQRSLKFSCFTRKILLQQYPPIPVTHELTSVFVKSYQ